MGDLGNRFGELAEHMVAPSINEKFNALGYHFDAIAAGGFRIDGPNRQTLAEIDILLQNGESMVAVEVKAKLLDRHIDEHIKRIGVLRRATAFTFITNGPKGKKPPGAQGIGGARRGHGA
jgi:hypothetical protein